ncbi:MAG: hypothetical protein AAF602_20135, partial [Myxococcota bacterium]
MDIFEWLHPQLEVVADKDLALAEDVSHLSAWAVDGDQARVKGALPRIVAEARRHGWPWIEVYARHWGLQSSLVRHYRIHEGLREAVELVERAHRADARDCPQSICATQDLCIAYRLVDGIGYAAERERASLETLARIGPEWPCWRCIGEELITALIDSGRVAEALAWVDDNFELRHRRESGWGYTRLLVEAGRLDEATAHVSQIAWANQGEIGTVGKPVTEAWVDARAGRLAEAAEKLPPFGRLLAESCDFHEFYVETLAAVIQGGQLEQTMEHTQIVSRIARTLEARGARGPAVNVALMWARHSLAEPAPSLSLAQRFLAHAESGIEGLRSDVERERAAAIRAELDRSRIALPAGLDAVQAWVQARQEAGTFTFDDADAVARAFPGWSGLVQRVAEHWRVRGWPEESHGLLQAAIEASPDDLGLRIAWIEQLTQQGDWDTLEPLAQGLPDEGDTGMHRLWYLGRVAE